MHEGSGVKITFNNRNGIVTVLDTDTMCDSPVKAVPCEDALGKPYRSFSLDEHFALDSVRKSQPGAAHGLDDNWSPVAMGKAGVSLENRVSPLKPRVESQLLGGLHPVT